VCAEYAVAPLYPEGVPPPVWAVKLAAVLIVACITVINSVSVDLAARVQVIVFGYLSLCNNVTES
jgi:hypothetical protein